MRSFRTEVIEDQLTSIAAGGAASSSAAGPGPLASAASGAAAPPVIEDQVMSDVLDDNGVSEREAEKEEDSNAAPYGAAIQNAAQNGVEVAKQGPQKRPAGNVVKKVDHAPKGKVGSKAKAKPAPKGAARAAAPNAAIPAELLLRAQLKAMKEQPTEVIEDQLTSKKTRY